MPFPVLRIVIHQDLPDTFAFAKVEDQLSINLMTMCNVKGKVFDVVVDYEGIHQDRIFRENQSDCQTNQALISLRVAVQMIAELIERPDCNQLRREIRKLPNLRGYSKHLLSDGNPRCLAFHLLQVGSVIFALLEVDTSDNSNRLSTLVLKQHASISISECSRSLLSLEIKLLKGTLVWPTSYLKRAYSTGFRRIPHPRSSSSIKSLLDPDSIHKWAERMHSELISF